MELIAPIKLGDASATPVASSAAGTYFDSAGVLQAAPANTPRITYDPSDLSAAPYLLLEPAATNSIRNNTMQGAQGSLPTDCGFSSLIGLSGAVTGKGVEDGIDFVEIRVSGTATGAGFAVIWFNADVSGLAAGQSWAASMYVTRVGGTKQQLQSVILCVDENSSSGFVAGGNAPLQTELPWRQSRQAYVRSLSGGPSVTALVPHIKIVTSGAGPVDITVRIGLPQLERDRVTSPIKTSSVAVTRAADVLAGGTGLLWSNVVENDTDDGALYLGATAYAIGARVRRPNHRCYVALLASTGKTPEDNTAGTTPAWQDIGPTKRWSPFDGKYSTIASAPEVVYYLVRPGAVATAGAALGLDGSDVRMSMIDATSGALVYRSTKNLRIKNSRSITDYLFRPIVRRRDEVFDDLPPFKNGVILLTVTKPGSVARIADFVTGRIEDCGEAQWEPEIRTLRRSLIKDNGFGDLTFTKRRSSKLITVNVSVPLSRVDDVVRLLDDYTAEPCVIIGDKRWTSMIILGFVQDFRLVLDAPDENLGALYNAQIQGFA